MVQKHTLEQALIELGVEDRMQGDNVLSVAELEALLAKVFVRLSLDHSTAEECTELTLNWVLRCCDRYRKRLVALFQSHFSLLYFPLVITMTDHNIFHRGRTGGVKVRSLKVGLVALCSATLEEKYRCKPLSI